MVLVLKRYSFMFQRCLKGKHPLGRKLIFHCQRKHLSKMVPFQNKQSYLKEKMNEFLVWYDEITGMDEVRQAQKRVVEDEQHFRDSQQTRRDVLVELKTVQNKLKELYSELDKTDKSDDRYVNLITQEHKLLKEEKTLLDRFSLAEKRERESFAALSSSVKLSHEKERAQSERTKYWSIIGSVMGTIIGILGTSINNHFKMNELKELIQESSHRQLIENLHNYLESNEKLLGNFKEFVHSQESSGFNKMEEILNRLSSRLTTVEEAIKNVEEKNNSIPKVITVSEEEYKKVGVPLEEVAETLRKEHTQTKMLLFTLAVLSVLMPILTRYS